MNQQSNSTDYAHDTTGRLSATDKEMMAQVSMTNCNRIAGFSEEALTKNNASSPTLSTTPRDSSFLTEERMKNICMPKRIDFWRYPGLSFLNFDLKSSAFISYYEYQVLETLEVVFFLSGRVLKFCVELLLFLYESIINFDFMGFVGAAHNFG